ncbi:MAG: hypothetical protein HZA01_04405 [Nitrospinae bacterium]|nr:hypothetical protein [Nitrospinota bacterium]
MAFSLIKAFQEAASRDYPEAREYKCAFDKYVAAQQFYEFSEQNSSIKRYLDYYRMFETDFSFYKKGYIKSSPHKTLPFCLNNMAIHYLRQGKASKAFEILADAAAFDPSFPLTYFFWGELNKISKLDDPDKYFKKALDLEPGFQLAKIELEKNQNQFSFTVSELKNQ